MRKKIKEHKPSELLQMVIDDPSYWEGTQFNMINILDRLTSSKQVLRKDSKELQRRLDSLEVMGMCLDIRIKREFGLPQTEPVEDKAKWVRQYWETKIEKFKNAGM